MNAAARTASVDPTAIRPDKVATDRHGNTYDLWWSASIGRYVTIPDADDDE